MDCDPPSSAGATKLKGSVFPAILTTLCSLLGCAAPTATRSSTGQVGGAQLTAVFSETHEGYIHAQRPDGSLQPESYVLKNGGNFGGPRTDETMDNLGFDDISRVIAGPLASQNYVPSQDNDSAQLLIVVYWGTTVVPDDVNPKDTRSQKFHAEEYLEMEARQDAQVDAKSANILGYTDEIFRIKPDDPKRATLRDEIEQDRYYVVLLAYDYQFGRRFGPHKLVWETRFSIPEPGNDFEKAFPKMAVIAAKYFGQDSHGLVHHNLGEGHVEIGEPTSLGTLPTK
jgi:hypothetical protein